MFRNLDEQLSSYFVFKKKSVKNAKAETSSLLFLLGHLQTQTDFRGATVATARSKNVSGNQVQRPDA
jgi:hypothetical protein